MTTNESNHQDDAATSAVKTHWEFQLRQIMVKSEIKQVHSKGSVTIKDRMIAILAKSNLGRDGGE